MIDIDNVKLIDLVPANLRDDPSISASAEAIDQQLKVVTDIIPKIAIIQNIDTLPEAWVDQLAYQFHVDFYDPSAPVATKRALVKNSLRWHKKKGTPSAVVELIETIFGSGDVEEWFEYGGQPYYFKVTTSDPSATTTRAQELIDAVNSVKNTRSWLESVEISMFDDMNFYFGFPIHSGEIMTIRQVT